MEGKPASEWCYEQRDICLKEGKQKEAEHYLNLAVLWKERERFDDGRK